MWPFARYALLLLVFALFGNSPQADKSALPLQIAINKAGCQRMLPAHGQGILPGRTWGTPEASKAQLAEARALFETQLAELKRGSKDLTVKQALAEIERLWPPFEVILPEPVSREGARRLAARDDALLQAADGVVPALQELSDFPHARLVNISGRQRMLSQRVAKFYALRAWDAWQGSKSGSARATNPKGRSRSFSPRWRTI